VELRLDAGDSSPGLEPHDMTLAYKSSEGSLLSQQYHFELKIEIGKLKLLLPPWTMFKIKPGTVSFADNLLQLLLVWDFCSSTAKEIIVNWAGPT